jgi:hypothetical protein
MCHTKILTRYKSSEYILANPLDLLRKVIQINDNIMLYMCFLRTRQKPVVNYNQIWTDSNK